VGEITFRSAVLPDAGMSAPVEPPLPVRTRWRSRPKLIILRVSSGKGSCHGTLPPHSSRIRWRGPETHPPPRRPSAWLQSRLAMPNAHITPTLRHKIFSLPFVSCVGSGSLCGERGHAPCALPIEEADTCKVVLASQIALQYYILHAKVQR
jgi:hypothetical protein